MAKELVTRNVSGLSRNTDGDRRVRLENRVQDEAHRRLANVGWTDEARAASLAARRANSMARNNEMARGKPASRMAEPVSGIRANGRYRTENGATVFIPDGASSMPPAGNGDLVKTGDSILMIINGMPVRIGSTKVLSIGPDGNLLLSVGSRSLDLGRPDKWGKFTVSRNGYGTFLRMGNSVYVRFGNVMVSLEDGSVRGFPVRTRIDSRGVVVYEMPSRAGPGLKV